MARRDTDIRGTRKDQCQPPRHLDGVREVLTGVQHELFDLGGELCIPGHRAIEARQVKALEAALDWAGSFATGAVVAMGIAKRAIDGGLDGSLADGLDLEADGFAEVFGTEDAATGVRSFLDDGPGKASFQGR